MTRWYIEKKKEHYYKEAKRLHYRARSAFKLKQIQNKFKIIKQGDVVIDLGAAPGGWSQVAKEIVGDNGTVVGIDLEKIEPIKEVIFIQGDLTENTSIDKIKRNITSDKVDVVLSDMSPNISGNYSVDQARSIYLCEHSLNLADIFLKTGGNFICKVFVGEDLQGFIIKLRRKFKIVKQFSPQASRKTSSEIYLVAKSNLKN